jgi:alkaline phosphatase D
MEKGKKSLVTRRDFFRQTASLSVGSLSLVSLIPDLSALEARAYQAMGTRAGEITDTTAIVWTRLTAAETRNKEGLLIKGTVQDYKGRERPKVTVPVDDLEGACPGIGGFVRLRYGVDEKLRNAKTTSWVNVSDKTDFIHQFSLKGLTPGTSYYYESESVVRKGGQRSVKFRGKFETSPSKNATSPIRFCVMTCQGYPDRGHADGHDIYPAMLALKPRFTCLTGDLVYYDNDLPSATTSRLARFHWERMFSLPRLVEFNRNNGTYWVKDDHDTLANDSGPGGKFGELTFAEGQQIFRQQAPLVPGAKSYRTFRWGQDLQIWLTDGRDFRSPNNMPDGPGKTILGQEQKLWLKQTLKESTATWKVLISPTPLVGPDRNTKNDNHTNSGFKHEGDELRNWFKDNVPDNFFVICGDRHWQYHSVHPETGLNEFSIGAASNEHAGGTPGEDKNYHRFHLVMGGFLSVDVQRNGGKCMISVHHHNVQGEVVYQWEKEREVS